MILQTNGIVYYGLVLHDLPSLEHGGLLKMLKKYNVAFQVNRSIDPDHIGSKVPSFSVIHRDLRHTTLDEKCRKTVPSRR